MHQRLFSLTCYLRASRIYYARCGRTYTHAFEYAERVWHSKAANFSVKNLKTTTTAVLSLRPFDVCVWR